MGICEFSSLETKNHAGNFITTCPSSSLHRLHQSSSTITDATIKEKEFLISNMLFDSPFSDLVLIMASPCLVGIWCTYRSIYMIQSIPSTRTNFDDKFQSWTPSLESHSKTFQYRAAEAVQGTDQTECIICLAPFEEQDSVRKLRRSRHIFHTISIDTWSASHSGCPLCRTQIDYVPPSPNVIEEVSISRKSVASEENDPSRTVLFLVGS